MDREFFADTDFVCFHNYLAIFSLQTRGTVLYFLNYYHCLFQRLVVLLGRYFDFLSIAYYNNPSAWTLPHICYGHFLTNYQ